MTDKKYPAKLWLQLYDDDGEPLVEPTFEEEKIYKYDACYIRAGKRRPEQGELENWKNRAMRSQWVVKQLLSLATFPEHLEVITSKDSEGWYVSVMTIEQEPTP